MRDRPYAQAKPSGTFRIALLGASYEMGGGVEDARTFENLVEDRLNKERAGGAPAKYEILNFSVGGYSTFHNVIMAQTRVFAFQPDIVLFALHTTEEGRLRGHLRRIVQQRLEAPRYLEDAITQSGATADMEGMEINRRLDPVLYDVIGWSLREIAAQCRRHEVICASMFVPTIEERGGMNRERLAILSELARKEGFLALNLDGAYGSHAEPSLRLAPWDTHPGQFGHQLLAERLYKTLEDHHEVLQLGLATPAR
jgi:hypothetical protein